MSIKTQSWRHLRLEKHVISWLTLNVFGVEAAMAKIDPQLPVHIPITVEYTIDYVCFQSTKSCLSTEPTKKGEGVKERKACMIIFVVVVPKRRLN